MKSSLLKLGLASVIGFGAVTTSCCHEARHGDAVGWWNYVEYVARGAAANMELFTSNNVKVEVFPVVRLVKLLRLRIL